MSEGNEEHVGDHFDKVATRAVERTTAPTLDVVSTDLTTWSGDALIVNLFEGVTSPGGATGAVDKALNGQLSEAITAGDLSGKAGQVFALRTRGALRAERVIVVGLGPQESFDTEVARRASAAA